MSNTDPAEEMLAYLVLPPDFVQAPPWARRMYQEMREHRQSSSDSIAALSGQVTDIKETLGKEPNSDGAGGEGLIGDLRRVTHDVRDLKSLKVMGAGFVSAMTLFGALIFMGVGQWITNLLGKH